MLHAGLDLSRRRVDACLISDQGELIDHFPQADRSLRCEKQTAARNAAFPSLASGHRTEAPKLA